MGKGTGGGCLDCASHADQIIETGFYFLGYREPANVSAGEGVTSGLWKAGLHSIFKYKAWHVALGR